MILLLKSKKRYENEKMGKKMFFVKNGMKTKRWKKNGGRQQVKRRWLSDPVKNGKKWFLRLELKIVKKWKLSLLKQYDFGLDNSYKSAPIIGN